MSLDKLIIKIISLLLMMVITNVGYCQDSLVTIHGKVIQEPSIGFADLLVVNAKTGAGVWGKPDGTFTITIHKNDPVKVSCTGFSIALISVKDSTFKEVYNITVLVKIITIEFKRPVVIRPKPSLREIDDARSKIGSHHYDPWAKPANISNPISMFYQLFSNAEEEKKEYIALLNQKEHEDALKIIIRYFIDTDLFYLSDDEVEKFIAYCNVNPQFVKNASMYDVGQTLYNCYHKYEGSYSTLPKGFRW